MFGNAKYTCVFTDDSKAVAVYTQGSNRSFDMIYCNGIENYESCECGVLDVKDDLGDFSFFNSNYICHNMGVRYPNTSFSLKTNTVECEKFDYKNPNKGDRIILKKQTNDDCYMDITAEIFKGYKSNRKYMHFKLSGNFMCSFKGESKCCLFQLIDTEITGVQTNEYPITVNSDGSLTLIENKVIHNIAKNGIWFNVSMYVNMKERTVTILVNDELACRNVPLQSGIRNLNMARVMCCEGSFTGEMQCRNMEFTGLDKPYEGKEIKTSMFGDDSELIKYLSDKTCFNYYGACMIANGVKEKMEFQPLYNNGELYISLSDFNKAYNCVTEVFGEYLVVNGNRIKFFNTPVFYDGVAFIPLSEAVKKAFNQYVFDDTNGMVITARCKLDFKVEDEIPYYRRKVATGYIDRFSNLQYIYDYVLFDRPSRDSLLELFNTATDNGKMHPRIMATSKDFKRIRELVQTDDYIKMVVNSIIAQADKICEQEPISFLYDDNLRTLNTAKKLESRMFLIGFAYQLTGARKYSDCAWENLNALSDFPDINPGHPIDTGSYGVGIAIGYDWCFEAFTENQRRTIRENSLRLHLTVIAEGFYGRIPARTTAELPINLIGIYNKWISNYNIWVNSGSLMMSLAFMDTYPETCADLLWHSIRSLEYPFKNLYPDGAWIESSGYWEIVSRCMAYVFGTLDTIYRTDFNLSRFPGTDKTGLTNMMLRGMTGNYNYHDATPSKTYAGYTMSFLGKYFNQPELLAARYATLKKKFDKNMASDDIYVFDALYYDPNVKIEEIKKLPRTNVVQGLEAFTVHEDYTDYNGLFFASHGGPVTFYHSHNDNGDFVFDLNGVRWACALGSEDYNSSLCSAEKYRVRTEGHNTITINNGLTLNQLADTYNRIISYDEREGGAFAVYDMSSSYADSDSFLRGFYIGDNYRTLTIRDEISLNNNNSEIYWFMHTQASAEIIDDHTVVLSHSGKTIVLNFKYTALSAKVQVMEAVPLSSSPKGTGQNSNEGYRKVAIRLIGSGKVTLTVRLGEFEGEVDETPILQWTAPDETEKVC